MKAETFIHTRSSLLKRLKNWQDQESWREFHDRYAKLIFSVAIKAGLTETEAQDVLQETLLVAARKLPRFVYDPAIGSFKSWLLLITRRRIAKQLKKRLPVHAARASRSDETSRTATIERIPDPAAPELDSVWEREWETSLSRTAMLRVKQRVKPRQFQIFDLYVLKQWPVREVARALAVSIAQIYVAKHRVGALLKQELQRLQKSEKP